MGAAKQQSLAFLKKSVRGGPRHIGVAYRPTRVAKFFFGLKLVF